MVGVDVNRCNHVVTPCDRNHLGSPGSVRSRRIRTVTQTVAIVDTPRVDSWEYLLRLPRDQRFFVSPPLESFCGVRIHRGHHI